MIAPVFSHEQKVQELRHELRMRQRWCEREVQLGRMNLQTMQRRVGILRALIEDYERPAGEAPPATMAEGVLEAAEGLVLALDRLPHWVFEAPEREAIDRLRRACGLARDGRA